MAKINSIIPAQGFEIVRDRIAGILAEELANQHDLSSEEVLTAKTWIARSVAFDHTELPAINVSLGRGDYSNKDMRHVDGSYTYFIDCATCAPSSDVGDGDTIAELLLHRLMGVVRAILEHPAYKTLGVKPPFCSGTAVQSISIGDPLNQADAQSTIAGRLEYVVRIPETSPIGDPEPLRFNSTTVKLNKTNKGFVYSRPTAPPVMQGVLVTEYGLVLLTSSGKGIDVKLPPSLATGLGQILINQSGQTFSI